MGTARGPARHINGADFSLFREGPRFFHDGLRLNARNQNHVAFLECGLAAIRLGDGVHILRHCHVLRLCQMPASQELGGGYGFCRYRNGSGRKFLWLCSGGWRGILRCDSRFFSSGGFNLAVSRKSDNRNRQP